MKKTKIEPSLKNALTGANWAARTHRANRNISALSRYCLSLIVIYAFHSLDKLETFFKVANEAENAKEASHNNMHWAFT